MFKLFIKGALRNLWRNKTYSFLNIFGLAIGITCASLIFLWVEDELNYDTVYAKKDRLYTIRENQTYDGVIRTFNSSPMPMADAIKTEIPGIVNSCRMNRLQPLFSIGEKAVYQNGYYADPSVFNMFTLHFLQGTAADAFKQLNAVVITQKMARRFFGADNHIIGKTIRFDNTQDFLISGVIEDLPANSTLQLDWLAPYDIYLKKSAPMNVWGNNSTNTYVELAPNANITAINKQLFDFVEKKQTGATARSFLFAMNDWRMRDNFEDGKQTGGRITYIRMFSVIAWIILLIACINFMNLATARSEKRAKEVGVRKVLGAGKHLLIAQFLGEALLMSALAVLLSVALVMLALPAFNIMVEKQLNTGINQPLHFGALIGVALLCGIVAGSYPALYLSSFNPIFVFKGLKLKTGGPELIRKGLSVVQFTVSIVLIISTTVIYQQIQHIKNRTLGYDKDKLLSISVRGDMVKNFAAIRQDLINTGLVENAGLNSYNTMSIGNNTSGLQWDGKDENSSVLVSRRMVSPELISTMGLKLLAGRGFNNNAETDTANVIVTQSLAKLITRQSAISKIIRGNNGDHVTEFKVVGVVNDFVYGDMYGKSDPVIFYCKPQAAKFMYVRFKTNADVQTVLSKVEGVMKKDNPAFPFEYSFVDDQFNDRFKSETLIGTLSGVFAGLAIFISCLGLFGLATYTAERRTKEIGIRKVLGASVAGITALLSRDFLKLIAFSAVIAFPVAWMSMRSWLNSYAYRIEINWWVFIAAGVLTMLVAFVTISFQSIKAAVTNPVKSLRTE